MTTMPYNKKSDLPEAVRALPGEAQDIWLKAYNAASEEYGYLPFWQLLREKR